MSAALTHDARQLCICGLRQALDIRHYITEGIAATTYGEPRKTKDLDIVIALELNQLNALVQQLENTGFYVPGVSDVYSGQLRTLGIAHQTTIARADLMIAESSEFEQGQFSRTRAIEISGRGHLTLASLDLTAQAEALKLLAHLRQAITEAGLE